MDKKIKRTIAESLAGLFLLLFAAGLQYLARNTERFANWYTEHIYPLWVNSIGKVNSIFPFSLVEILLYLLSAILLAAVGKAFFGVLKKKQKAAEVLRYGLGHLICGVGILFFIYTTMCGINYHSDTFSRRSGLTVVPYTVEELFAYCEKITEEVNVLAKQVKRDGDGRFVLSGNVREEAVKAMKAAGKQYPALAGYYPKPKPLLLSEILSYQHLTGVYSPFTIEANYNADMTPYNIPFTMCHELSHLRGFMREDEANYIAYLACSISEEVEFQYSGALMAWLYSTNVLYEYDREAYRELSGRLDENAGKDLDENTKFWDAYEGAVSELSDKVNDTYLKANKQTAGVETYDQMVNLLMAEYLSGKEEK